MVSLAKPDKLTNDTLAAASPIEKFTNFIPDGAKPTNPAYAKDTSYGSALANHLKGSDLNPDKSEISTSFNIDLDDPGKFPDNHWYYGTDGKPDKGGFDFVTTALHEIAHGLDFLTRAFSLPPPQDSGGFVGGIPSAMDRFDIVGSTGKLLTSSSILSSACKGVLRISDDVFFNGPTAKAANGGKAVKLFDPTTFQSGSSMSHLDSSVGTDLMLPGGSDGFTTPTDIDLGILTDIGWTIIPEPSTFLLVLPTTALFLRAHPRDCACSFRPLSSFKGRGVRVRVELQAARFAVNFTDAVRENAPANGVAKPGEEESLVD